MLRSAVRRFVTREGIDGVLDGVRYRLDTFPHGIDQPVASFPVRSAMHGEGMESRWEAMLPVVRDLHVASAVDVGAAEGYFAIQLGRSGIPTVAIEGDPPAFRTALYAIRKTGVEGVGVLALELKPENLVSVPAADCMVFLSVWHHFVRARGVDVATEMLAAIWERTGKVLFFDTGENEMTPDFGLPEMKPDPRSWLGAYLAETCEGSRVEHLGTHSALDPSGAPCERNLFAVIRV
jgi:hypothetical protein